MKRFILTLIAVSLLGTLSFAGVAKESYKAGKFVGKESVKVLKPEAKVVSFPARHPKKFAKGAFHGAKKVLD